MHKNKIGKMCFYYHELIFGARFKYYSASKT